MKNLFVSKLNEKDVEHCTSNAGLFIRRKFDKPFKKLCNVFTNANIIKPETFPKCTDEEYFRSLSHDFVPATKYPIKKGKNNIILERYPCLNKDEPYIFVGNHTCPEDVETILNVIDRNVYFVLGSLEVLRYDPEMYLSWLNGTIPFDILNQRERKMLIPKMKRVLKTNSILIFPEGSHNHHPCNIINPLFDGPVNLSLQTGRKIVVVTMVKDKKNNTAFIDCSNPVDARKLNVEIIKEEKKYVNALTNAVRDKMATAAYTMIERHIPALYRAEHPDIVQEFHNYYIQDAFSGLPWKHDVFEAEYLVKKHPWQREFEDVIHSLASQNIRDWVRLEENLMRNNVADFMREYWKTLS